MTSFMDRILEDIALTWMKSLRYTVTSGPVAPSRGAGACRASYIVGGGK